MTTQYLVEDDVNPTGYPQVFDELVGGAVTRTYTYGLQRVSQEQQISSAWTASFYGYDGFGTVRQLTNLAGAVTDTYEYDAYGNEFTVSGTTPNNYLYRGEQYDSDLGFYYLRARYYNPLNDRLVSRDPDNGVPTAPATLHKYTYAGGDPVNLTDPSGRAQTRTGVIGGGAGEYIGLVAAAIALSGYYDVTHPAEVRALGDAVACATTLLASETSAWVTLDLAGNGNSGTVTRTGPCTAKVNTCQNGTEPGATYFHYGYMGDAPKFAGGLRPGSYATTIGILTGSQAKAGLALPHEFPPDAVYPVTPEPCTPIVGPTPAEPKFGQPGGLPEVNFPDGTGPGTVGPPIPIAP